MKKKYYFYKKRCKKIWKFQKKLLYLYCESNKDSDCYRSSLKY